MKSWSQLTKIAASISAIVATSGSAERTVATGQHSLIIGPSGSGKSTLLHLIAGLLRPSRGRLQVAGQDLGALAPAALDAFRGRAIGIVLQRLHLIPALTVRDNLRLGRTLAGLPPDPARIETLITDLGLRGLAGARPSRLSQGEAQRVAIARAVVKHPVLILADEPTSALDDANCETVLALLRAQAEASGATLLIAGQPCRELSALPPPTLPMRTVSPSADQP